MSELFGVDIQGIVTDAFEGNLLPAELKRSSVEGLEYNAVEDRYEDEQGNTVDPEDQIFTTEGIVDSFSDGMISGGHATEKERKIMLLAQPLGTVPKIGDTITIDSETMTVTGTPRRDPATATWTIRAEV